MSIDIKKIGTFGISFSKGLDQTWFNLWLKDYGYSMDFYQNVEDETSDDEDEIIDTSEKITFEQGEEILRQVLENGRIEEWKSQYTVNDEGVATDLSWTIDIDDINDADMLFLSGNGKFPPLEEMKAVIRAIRVGEERFAKCFKNFNKRNFQRLSMQSMPAVSIQLNNEH